MKPMSAQQDESSQSLLFDQLGLTVFERGWLSSNCLLLQGDGPSALVDSGYAIHSTQTLALVREALGGDPLDLLLNTHLHSDHCGGNHLLQSRYPHLRTLIPPGLAVAVSDWDPVALTFEPTGQHCDPFRFDGLLLPGETIKLGPLTWEIHAAKGHDPHSVILFQADHRVLISADALWQNGFGVVFPELEGKSAFEPRKPKPPGTLGTRGFGGLGKSLTMTYFHTGTRTIIGAKAFHCPVRDGKEWYHLAMVVRHNLLSWLARCHLNEFIELRIS
jgi:glyoxylase-like metal-dependent hydrolase (beta-lactamase superfamily II)